MDWKLYSFIVRSKQRKDIFLLLEKTKTPTEIANELKLSTSHVSRTLKQFLDKDIIKCLTPGERIGKIYQLTERGRRVLRELK